jgi:signal transduction histidine kinase
MKITGWIPESIQAPSSAKWNTLIISTIFVFNVVTFSAWAQLSHVLTKPWLILVWLYGLAVLVPLIWRDRAPITVFVTQWVFTVAAWPIMPHYAPIVGIPVSLYAVTVHCARKVSLCVLFAAFIPDTLAAAVAFRVYPEFSTELRAFIGDAVFLFFITAAAWGAGRLTQASRRHVQHLEHERECLQRERETAREAVAAERRRIARELHDIVSHAVTVIVLQAAGAARVAETNFAQVIVSLGHIQSMGEQAMAELGRLLGVLQASDAASPDVGLGDLGPQSGLAELTVLLGSLRATGMPVTVDVEGTPRELDPSVDLAAYRIVQEGLTNVLKHAGKDANARLRLAWEARRLLIQIDNDTNPAEANHGQRLSNGRGLLGLQERVYAAGGQLHAGPAQHQDSYRLTATLPLTDTAQKPNTEETHFYIPSEINSE